MISVVIPNHDGRVHLETCLPALMKQEGAGAFEIVVVDNASTDGSPEYVRREFPSVRVIDADRNRGFAGACNLGARAARGELLAFLNNDTAPSARWLALLRRALSAAPGPALVTSHIVYFDGRTVDSAGDGYLRCGGAYKRRHGMPVIAETGVVEVFGACGAAFMIRRDLFAALEGFDEDFFLAYEDVDLSYRARLGGAVCLFVPEAIVLHRGSASIGRLSPLAVFHGQRNLEWTFVKNTPGALLWRTLPSHVVYSVAAGLFYIRRGHGAAFFRAKLAALNGLPLMWRKRRRIQSARRVPAGAIESMMDRRWLALKLAEKRFDAGGRVHPR